MVSTSNSDAEDDDPPEPSGASLVPFPQSRVPPRRTEGGFTDLGLSDMARSLGAPDRQGTGHWCSYCRGIWYGYLLEVTCPRCGRRQG
jgi:hypothetical protein